MSAPNDATVQSIWDGFGATWSATIDNDVFRSAFHDPLFFGDFVPDLRGQRVIDLGCGEGRTSRILARAGALVTGIDLSGALIAEAEAKEAAAPLEVRYLQRSFSNLSGIEEASFDAAVSTMAFMDGPDFPRAAAEARRVLAANGVLYFSVYHPCFVTRGSNFLLDAARESVRARRVGDYWSEPYVEHWRHPASNTRVDLPRFPYRLEEYVNGLIEAGFRIQRLMEPRATEAMVARRPRLLTAFREVTPLMLFVAAAVA